VHHRTGERSKPGKLGDVGLAADPAGRVDDVLWVDDALGSIGEAQGRVPPFGGFVVARAAKLGRTPDVQVEIPRVYLQPLADHVLRQVLRVVAWEGQEGESVHLHRVMQRKGVIARPPVVPDPLVFVDDQCVDTERAEEGGGDKARLSRADDEHLRLAVDELALVPAMFAPSFACGPRGVPGTAWVKLGLVDVAQRLQAGVESPRLESVL
jgi:hypothetical protein